MAGVIAPVMALNTPLGALPLTSAGSTLGAAAPYPGGVALTTTVFLSLSSLWVVAL